MITAPESSSPPKERPRAAGRLKAASATSKEDRVPGPIQNPQSTAPEEARQWSALKTRALLNSIADLVFSVTKNGMILEIHLPNNPSFNLPAETMIGKRVMDLLPVQIGQQAMHYLEKALRTGRTQTFTGPYQVCGQSREFEVRITGSGSAEAVAVVRDVTVRKISEKEILEISNREQVRIGQDLHDGLGQHLTGVTFLSRALENKLAARALPEAQEAAEIGRLVLQALSQTRNLARGLFPVELESSELAAAFRGLAATVEKLFNISCVVDSDEDLVIADRAVVNHLFRLAQEAINNSVKHGQAKRVVIGLKAVGAKTSLTIQDNGLGFRRDSSQPKGLGLRIMNYRAQKIGATFDIQPAEGGGTIVTCSLPA